MTDAKTKWNQIYRKNSDQGTVAAVLQANTSLLPTSGLALDLACGTGANTVFLASRGMQVEAWDISDVVINALAQQHADNTLIQPAVVDISPNALSANSYDLILVCHYLDRTLVPAISDALRPGGLAIYQTFTADKKVSVGPSNPDFLLKKNELERFVTGFDILASAEGSEIVETSNPMAGRAYVIARKPPPG